MRIDGYAPIRDYAAIGDGRTTALVARDGSIDWLCLPDVDSPPVFGRLLDAERGGSFRLEPAEPFESERTYREGSNVLETAFRTRSGTVRVTDALTLADRTICSPMRELVRRVEAVDGRVPMRWSIEPTFEFGRRGLRVETRRERIVVASGRDALAVGSWHAGKLGTDERAIRGEFVSNEKPAVIWLGSAHGEPLVYVGLKQADRSLERTDRFWPEWSGRVQYDGPWREHVVRAALVLKLLVYSPSGAIVAAPTTSLPEQIGGVQRGESEAEGVPGYRGSRPVRIGNGAAGQVQLDIYGSVLDGIWRYSRQGGHIDKDTGKDVAAIADYVTKIWEQPDSGMWSHGPSRRTTRSRRRCAGSRSTCRSARRARRNPGSPRALATGGGTHPGVLRAPRLERRAR
jgi:GH15 family glucan-1,4-alpha-glucosidase